MSENLNQKIAIVTGANKGIGFSLVKELAKKFSGLVYLTARNETLGKQAVKELENLEIKNVKFQQLDISDIESIKQFESFMKSTHGGIDILINNAAILCNPNSNKPLKQQIEEVVNVNYFSTLNLCNALFPLLRPHARVVNVTSDWGLPYYIRNEYFKNKLLSKNNTTVNDVTALMEEFLDHLKRDDHVPYAYEGYKMSKNAVNLVTKLQQDEIERKDKTIIISSCNPGDVKTDMNSTGSLTPDEATQTILYLALQPHDSKIPRGEFWFQMNHYQWNNLSLDLNEIFGGVYDFDDINSR